jgi:putative membrane-bound dehydrogenase-like protein
LRCPAAAQRLRCLVAAMIGGTPVGAAKVDVTPDFPIRLCGYAARDKEADGVEQKLYARAFAVGDDGALALLIAADQCAVPAAITEEIAARLAQERGLARERVTICSTHTHTGPWLEGSIECMFGRPVPDDQLERVRRYTRLFVEKLVEAGRAAIDARAPAHLAWAEGSASFAVNRRTRGGPVDRSLPVLAAFGDDGTLRVVVQSYACHCTTCGPAINKHCGDWAGYASELVESAHPGAVALTIIGCGADSNPAPGVTSRLQDSIDHGRAVANEVERLLAGEMKPLLAGGDSAAPRAPVCRLTRLELPFDALPTREQLLERVARAKPNDPVGYHASWWLAKLERGEPMPATLPYFVQSWQWGDELAQLFLSGEVVVDYSLRLKRELDRSRLWVSAYANDVACYIPSRRILAEGGYEAEGAMTYYGRPTRLAPGCEEAIVAAARALLSASFASDEQATRFPPPKTPAEALACLRAPSFDVELVASEPAIESPVAIDFAADGSVWVCEMNDYPSGMDGKYAPGGRVKRLRDRDGDGKHETSELFLDGLPFPTGVMAWRRGALVCAAPDVLYAEDVDGDGKADVKRVLFTGFSTENYQARVNSLTWGLDGWVYGACGLFGGVINGVDCRGRDFRIDPDRGVIEAIEGTSQQGRVRDDFGRWFGCDSGWLAFQLPLADRYVRRNPFVAPVDPRWNLLDDGSGRDGEDPRALFQMSPRLERFNDFGDASRVTSACGIGVYRDVLLGAELHGDLFTCEPVANLVRRTVLRRADSGSGANDVVLHGRRALEESLDEREFLASSDPWFRPVQAVTGPDGALWVVDMARFVIEHPRWIPAAKLAELDVRAGADLGRLWRVLPKGGRPRPVRDLTKLEGDELRGALFTPNGVVRDLVHRELLQRPMPFEPPLEEAGTPEEKIGRLVEAKRREVMPSSPRAAAAIELQRAWIREQQHALSEDELLRLLSSDLPVELRAQVLVLCERHFHESPRLAEFVAGAVRGSLPASVVKERRLPSYGPDPLLVFQAALSLGEWDRPRAGELLGEILARHLDDPWIRAAVLSSATKHADAILAKLLAAPSSSPPSPTSRDSPSFRAAVTSLLATLAGAGDRGAIERAFAAIEPKSEAESEECWRWSALARLDRGRVTAASRAAARALDRAAEALVAGTPPDLERTLAALDLLPQRADPGELSAVATLVDSRAPPELLQAATSALARLGEPSLPKLLLPKLAQGTPLLRALVLDALMQRPAWLASLLDAAESEPAVRRAFDAAHRDRLLHHEDAVVRARAEKLLAPAGTPARAAVLARFQPALERKGEPSKGRATFERLCASCHRFRGIGHDVAPDLLALGDRGSPRLLESILDPNAAVNADFLAYNVELADGDVLNGLIRGESSTGFTLLQANDLRRELLRRDVKSVRPSKLSLMPEGLEEGLEPSDLADLIAWLQSGPAPLESVTAEQAAAARAALRELAPNGCARVLSAFDVFTQPSWLGPCTMRYCRQDDGRGKVTWKTASVPKTRASDASAGVFAFRFPVAIGFLSQPKGSFTLTLDGKPLLEFDVAVDDARWQSADGRATLDFECRAANREDATGLMTLTLPAELLRPGEPATLEVTGSAAGSQRWFGVLVPEE